MCVGRRAAALLARRRVGTARTYGAPAGVSGITEVLLKLAEDILTLYATEDLSAFEIVSSRFGGVGTDLPTNVRLLPLDAKRFGQAPPVRYVGMGTLASAAIREFLYITLYDVLLGALAAEHGARLVATQSAERWLEEKTERVRHHLASMRRESSTQEILEIATGARARTAGRSS
jgi:F-type H+-transporting ATPase subunit gamma